MFVKEKYSVQLNVKCFALAQSKRVENSVALPFLFYYNFIEDAKYKFLRVYFRTLREFRFMNLVPINL